jgi:site-specific DNA recombinase
MNEFYKRNLPDNAEPMKAIVYCRISSKAQELKGSGLESQQTRCREYSGFKGYQVVKVVYDTAISGKLLERPGIKEVLQFLKREKRMGRADQYVVVFDDISRLARDIRTHMDLRDAIFATGAQMDCPTVEFRQDSDGLYFEGMQALNAQHHRLKNAEQTKARMRARAMGGYWPFHSPPGYKFQKVVGRGNLLFRDEPLASIIQEALEGFASGRLETQGEVKRFLESQPEFMAGRKSKKRWELRYEEVYRFLTRPHYAGYIEVPEWGITLRKANHEGLISLEQYERIQERMKEGARAPARKDINADFILRGAIACADCGKPLTACWSKSKTGKKHPYYLCFAQGCESYRKSIPRDKLESEFEVLLQRLSPGAETFQIARAMFKQAWETRLAQAKEIAATLKSEVGRLDKQIEQLLDRVVEASNASTVSAYERRIAKLEKEKLLASEKLAQKPGPKRTFEEMFELACGFLSSPWNIWQIESMEAKKTVLKLAFAERPAYSRNSGFRTPKTTLPFKVLDEIFRGHEVMAEKKGFEPSIPFPVYSLSRGAPSTTRPPLRSRFHYAAELAIARPFCFSPTF